MVGARIAMGPETAVARSEEAVSLSSMAAILARNLPLRKKNPQVVENRNNGNRRETSCSQRNPLRGSDATAMLSGMAAAPRRPGPIDETSKRIIEQLQADGRRPYGEIGKAVGLSEAAVRQRVQKLTETGVMQIVAVTDPLQLGFHRQAMIGIRVSGDTRTVADELERLPAVDYLVMTAGSFDLMVEVVCEDDDGLIELLNGTIRAIPGVAATETFVYLQLRKQLYDWGTR